MFERFRRKWHSVHWRCGDRHVNLSVHFDSRRPAPDGVVPRPTVDKLPVRRDSTAPAPAEPTPAAAQVVAEVLAAVEEFNKRNRTGLRVAGIRYSADDTTGHREATRKLLNRL